MGDHLAWSPFLNSRITLLARPTSFQKTLWLTQPGHFGLGKTIRAWVSVIGPGKGDLGWEGDAFWQHNFSPEKMGPYLPN